WDCLCGNYGCFRPPLQRGNGVDLNYDQRFFRRSTENIKMRAAFSEKTLLLLTVCSIPTPDCKVYGCFNVGLHIFHALGALNQNERKTSVCDRFHKKEWVRVRIR